MPTICRSLTTTTGRFAEERQVVEQSDQPPKNPRPTPATHPTASASKHIATIPRCFVSERIIGFCPMMTCKSARIVADVAIPKNGYSAKTRAGT